MKEEDKNIVVDIPEVSGLKEIEDVIELLPDEIECNDDVPVKVKRKYVWKGDKKRQRSEEHNAKIAKALSGRQLSSEHKHNIAESMVGNQNFK